MDSNAQVGHFKKFAIRSIMLRRNTNLKALGLERSIRVISVRPLTELTKFQQRSSEQHFDLLMSFQTNWGYSNPYDEYGNIICVKKEPEVAHCESYFCTARFNRIVTGCKNIRITIQNDYEPLSIQILIGFLSSSLPNILCSAIDLVSIWAFSPIQYEAIDTDHISRRIKDAIDLVVAMEEVAAHDQYFYMNFLSEILFSTLRGTLYQQERFQCQITSESEPCIYFGFFENKESNYVNAVSIENITVSSDLEVIIRFVTKVLRVTPITFMIEEGNDNLGSRITF
jgi:hypothetical protein